MLLFGSSKKERLKNAVPESTELAELVAAIEKSLNAAKTDIVKIVAIYTNIYGELNKLIVNSDEEVAKKIKYLLTTVRNGIVAFVNKFKVNPKKLQNVNIVLNSIVKTVNDFYIAIQNIKEEDIKLQADKLVLIGDTINRAMLSFSSSLFNAPAATIASLFISTFLISASSVLILLSALALPARIAAWSAKWLSRVAKAIRYTTRQFLFASINAAFVRFAPIYMFLRGVSSILRRVIRLIPLIDKASDVLIGEKRSILGMSFGGLLGRQKGNSLVAIADALRTVSIDFALVGILALPAIVGVLSAILLIKTLNVCLKLLKNIKVGIGMWFKTIAIRLIVASIGVLALEVVLVGLIALLAIPALIVLTLFLLGLKAIFVLIKWVTNKPAKTLLSILVLTMLIGSLLITGVVFVKLSEILADVNWLSIFGLLLAIGAISLLTIIVGNFASSIIKGALTILLLSFTFILVAIAVNKMYEAAENVTLEAMLAFFGTLTAMVLATIGLGLAIMNPLVGVFLIVGVVALIGICGALWLAAKMLTSIQETASSIDENATDTLFAAINKIIANINDLSLIDLGLALPKALLLASALVPIGIVALIMSKLATLSFVTKTDENGKPVEDTTIGEADITKAIDNVKLLVSAAVDIIKNTTEQLKDLSVFDVAKSVLILSSAITPIANLADLMSKLAEGRIATEWDKNGKPTAWKSFTDIDMGAITSNISIMLNGFTEALKGSGLSDDSSFFGEDGPLASAVKGTELITDSIKPISEICDLFFSLASGKFATEWDKNGKPTAWKSFADIDMPTFQKTITDIIKGYSDSLISAFGTDTGIFKDNVFDNVAKNVAKIKDTTSFVNDIFDAIKTMNELQKGENKVTMGTYLQDYSQAFIDFAEKQKEIEKARPAFDITKGYMDIALYQLTKDKVKLNKEFLDNNIKFLEKVTKLDKNTLQGATDFYSKLTDFSKSIKGDFKDLAEAFSDKLMEVLDKLNETLETVNDTTIHTSYSGTPSGYASAPANNTTNYNSNVNVNNSPSQKVDFSDVTKAIQELQRTIQQGVQVRNQPTSPIYTRQN